MKFNDFLFNHAFDMKDEVKDVGNGKCELYHITTPKKNIWFYLWYFIVAFKCIGNIDKVESEDSNGTK